MIVNTFGLDPNLREIEMLFGPGRILGLRQPLGPFREPPSAFCVSPWLNCRGENPDGDGDYWWMCFLLHYEMETTWNPGEISQNPTSSSPFSESESTKNHSWCILQVTFMLLRINHFTFPILPILGSLSVNPKPLFCAYPLEGLDCFEVLSDMVLMAWHLEIVNFIYFCFLF